MYSLLLAKAVLRVFAVVHVIFTLLYLAPNNALSKTYMPIVSSWIQPFFYQNWELFGRMVGRSTLFLRYKCEGESFWRYFGSSALKNHQSNRLTRSGKDYYFFNYLAKKTIEETLRPVSEENYPLRTTSEIVSKVCSSSFKLEIVVALSPHISEKAVGPLEYTFSVIHSYGIVNIRD